MSSVRWVIPGGQPLSILRRMVVSIIESGAGSVAVSARPTLPNTFATSGKVRMIRSVCCRTFLGLGDGEAGEGGGHIEQIALVQGRQELRAQLREADKGGDHQEYGHEDGDLGEASTSPRGLVERMVQPVQGFPDLRDLPPDEMAPSATGTRVIGRERRPRPWQRSW